MTTPADVMKFMKDNKTEIVDFKFNDFLGTWQHFSAPTSEMEEKVFRRRFGLRRILNSRMAANP